MLAAQARRPSEAGQMECCVLPAVGGNSAVVRHVTAGSGILPGHSGSSSSARCRALHASGPTARRSARHGGRSRSTPSSFRHPQHTAIAVWIPRHLPSRPPGREGGTERAPGQRCGLPPMRRGVLPLAGAAAAGRPGAAPLRRHRPARHGDDGQGRGRLVCRDRSGAPALLDLRRSPCHLSPVRDGRR